VAATTRANLGVARGRVDAGVTEQSLDDAHVGAFLQQVSGEAVAERMKQ